MRVVGIVPLYPPHSQVGAWISTHACLAHMVERGHQVDVVTSLARFPVHVLDGVAVHPRGSAPRVVPGADVVVSHLGDNGVGAMWAERVDARSVRMVHGTVPDALGLLEGAHTDLVVWNSQASAAEVDWHGPSITVYPPIRPADYRTTPGDAVTLVNLAKAKGGELFWRLADALPTTPFLGVMGGYGVQQLSTEAEAALTLGREQIGNVTISRPSSDMRAVYGRTRVLIVPSEVESFGRVGVEAMCSGIPVVAHPSPGLREALGDAAIWCDRDDIGAWVAALRRLEDPDEWQRWSRAAEAHVADLDPTPDLDRFADALEALCAPVAA